MPEVSLDYESQLLESLSTELQLSPDLDLEEFKDYCFRHFQAQKALDSLLRGELSFSQIGDLLDSLGIDPISWGEQILENLEVLNASIQ